MSYGVTAAGFTRPTLLELQTDLEAGWRVIFGNDVDLSASSPDSQILGIVVAALDEAWQAAEDAYWSYRPRSAAGAALSDLVGLIGLTRKLGTETTTTATVTTTGGSVTLSSAFRIESAAGDLFQPITPGVYADAAVVSFVAVSTGPIVVDAAEAWRIVTPVAGLTSIASVAAVPVLGTNGETDGELRARQIRSTESAATNIMEALYAAVLQVAGVSRARIYNNDTNGTVDGRPAHSYEVVLVGGAAADIGLAIWQRHPAGIEIFGVTSEVVVDSQGQNQTMKYTRPTAVPIIIEVTTSVDAGYPATGDEDIKQAIVDYAAGDLVEGEEFAIGDDVSLSRLYSATNSIPGHNVTLLRIGAPTLGTADLVIDENEVSEFDITDITVIS